MRRLRLGLPARLSPTGRGIAPRDPGPLGRFELVQAGLGPLFAGAEAVYLPVECLLAPTQLRAGLLLFRQGNPVVVLLLRDLAPRVPEILPGLLEYEEALPIL